MKRKSDSDYTEHINKETKVDESEAPSSTPRTSKKIQKKMDKQNALLQFRAENSKNDTEKLCPSCQMTSHARSTSTLCPNRKVKESRCESDEKIEQFVIKTSLHNICGNQEFVQELVDLVEHTNKVIYTGALFINFLFIKMLSDGLSIPIIDHDLFASAFALITGNGKKAPESMKEYFAVFCDLTSLNLDEYKSMGYATVISAASKQYETMARNHIHDNYERRTLRYFFNTLSDKTSVNYREGLSTAARTALSVYVYRKKEGLNPTWPSKIQDTEQNRETAEKLLDL